MIVICLVKLCNAMFNRTFLKRCKIPTRLRSRKRPLQQRRGERAKAKAEADFFISSLLPLRSLPPPPSSIENRSSMYSHISGRWNGVRKPKSTRASTPPYSLSPQPNLWRPGAVHMKGIFLLRCSGLTFTLKELQRLVRLSQGLSLQ